MLLGKFINKLDAKGRAILPSKFRGELSEQVILVKGYDKCLYIYKEEDFLKYIKEHVENRPDEDEEARFFKSAFYENSMPLEIDSQGRINLPNDFIEYAGIEKEMCNVGAISRIEIWAKEIFEEKQKGTDIGKLVSNMKKYIGDSK